MSKLTFESSKFSFTFSSPLNFDGPVSYVLPVYSVRSGEVENVASYPILTGDSEAFIHYRELVKALTLGYDVSFVDAKDSHIGYWRRLVFDVEICHEDSCIKVDVALFNPEYTSYEIVHSFDIPLSDFSLFLRYPSMLLDLLRDSEDVSEGCD